MRKILIHLANQFCIDSFHRMTKDDEIIIATNDEKTLFEYCSSNIIDSFILSNEFEYTQRAINTIRSVNALIPIVLIIQPNNMHLINTNADISYLISDTHNIDVVTLGILQFIPSQISLYKLILDLQPEKTNELYFGDGFKYSIKYRTLFLNEIELKRFSYKEGRLIEIFSKNYRKIVDREYIMIEIWKKSDIFVSRSLDVYITKLRNTFKEFSLNLQIKNISGVGLILE